MQAKVDAFLAANPRYARYTVETALITTEPVPENIRLEAYFTYLVTGSDLLAASQAQRLSRSPG